MTKIKSDLIELLSVNNLIPMITIIISFTVFLIRMDMGNQMLEYKIDQLSKKLDTYVQARETAAGKMAAQTEMRNRQISELQQDMARVKILIKLP